MTSKGFTTILAWACLLALPFFSFAQSNGGAGAMWSDIDQAAIPVSGTRYIVPTEFRTVRLDVAKLKEVLMAAPMERTPVTQMSSTYLSLPMPDGKMELFKIYESPIMEPGLAEKFPEINTYAGVGVEDPSMYVRFDLTPQGFHAMILTAENGSFFIDPYSFGGGDIQHYICYAKKDFRSSVNKSFNCEVNERMAVKDMDSYLRFGSCELRTYRLALAATGEYTAFHGGTVAGAQAAQVTSMNRVNGVYEREMAIRMNIVANNNLIIYTNSATDPYTNNNGSTMLGQNQTTCDGVIGSANYDIGHVFSTGGGGVAYLQSVCRNNKAGGVTGSAAPVGDPFDIDYVAHEMGHQFGGNHTQNNNCNRNGATAMEPGSASTIMGYAGICAPNVQNNSNDYFHGVNMAEIGAFVTGGTHTCPVKTPLTNNAPTVSTSSTSYTIPISTPFALTAIGVDLDTADVLTYCWEQMNNQTATMPPVATATGGPNFRSFSPTTNPTRYFPNLNSLRTNGPYTWEVLPSVARTMNFRVVIRDNKAGGGCNNHADVTVNVSAAAGPFVVTYPSATGISWIATTSRVVTWNVANTNVAPVNSPNVDILLSTDGGVTYPTVVASNVPNTGSYSISVPNTPTTTARIMIRSSNGLFFDISDNNFAITTATPGYFLLANNATAATCPSANANYTINVGSILGYNDNVTMSVTGLPGASNGAFSVNPVVPGDSTVLTVSNLSGVAAGTYNVTVTASSTSGTNTQALTLQVYASTLAAVNLTTPANAATNVAFPTNFSWAAASGPGVTYAIQVSDNAAFTSTVASATGLTTNSYTASGLSSNTTYYWRVTATNPCTSSPASSTFSFSTPSCTLFTSTNVPVTISASGTPTVTSTLNIPASGTILDVNVKNLRGTHTWINDLTVRVASPLGTSVTLWNRICNDEDNFDINFDDAAASGTLPCPPTGGLTFRPSGTLSSFNGQSLTGNWVLTIVDNANQDGGALNSWALEVCFSPPASTLDAALGTTTNMTGNFCNVSSLAPQVLLRNDGNTTITSATITYNIDGGANSVYNWSGSLAAAQSSTVTLPSIAVTAGAHTFNATVSNPNGSADQNAANNAMSSNFTVLQNGLSVNLALTTDNFGGQTTWNITNSLGATVASGGPYPNGTPNVVYNQSICLASGCYTYTINDANGNGLSDGTNNGNYVITDSSGTSLVQMTTANFGNSASHTFCVFPTAVTNIELAQSFTVLPNPTNGIFTVAISLATAQDASVRLVNVLGQTIQEFQFNQQNINIPVDISNLASGVYYVVLNTDKGTESKKVTVTK